MIRPPDRTATEAPDRPRRHHRRQSVDAAAGYSVVEVAIAWPAFLLLVMILVQFTLVWHARHVAEAATREGLRAARAYGSTATAGQDAATTYLRRVAPHLLTGAAVTATGTPTTVTIRVHAHVNGLIGLADTTIDEQPSGPRELFAPPGTP